MKAADKLKGIHAPKWFGKRKEKKKEKEKPERALEPSSLKMATFVVTLASMMLGLSLLPFFPQPLPVILAFLVAFITFKRPRLGMPIGGVLIGLGLMYHLAAVNFISNLGAPIVRGAVIFVYFFLFIALPIVFHSYKAAIAINLGIAAAILLFFNQTYYLAVPLILTSVVFFKKSSILTVVFYALISVPLEVMQYLSYILQTTRPDWWVEAGSFPPIYVPLTQVFKGLEESMLQFRLYDTSKIVYAITDQITSTPAPAVHTVSEALSHYLDSIPGIVLFLVIVVGLVFAVSFFARFLLTSPGLGGERLLPTFTAGLASFLFFLSVSALQGPLAFRAQVNGGQIAIGTFATIMFTLPALLINPTPKKSATVEMILSKAKDLTGKLQAFEDQLNIVKKSIPVQVSSTEGKMLIIKDRLNDILTKASKGFLDPSESNEIFNELDKDISNRIDELTSELNVTLAEYHIYVNGEHSTWIGKLRDMGLEVKTTAKTDIQKELPLENRVERIKETLNDDRLVAKDTIQVSQQTYAVIRSLYDPTLPEESQTVAFAEKKLNEETTPWLSIEALYNSLNNWRKQYGAEISKSIGYIQSSLSSIANLSTQGERLLPALEDKFITVMDSAKKAADIKINIEKKPLDVANILIIRDVFEESLSIARGVISILYEELKLKEETIDSLLPSKDYLWERNVTLKDQMSSAMEIFSNKSGYELKTTLEILPKSLSYLDECIETLALYEEKKELLLNYPIAEIAIEKQLKQKKRVTVEDLPFAPKYAEEYLHLFYSKSFGEFSYDKENMVLTRKA